MKTLFVNAPYSLEIKNWMLGSFYVLAREHQEVRLVVFVERVKLEEHRKKFGHDRCIIEPVPDVADSQRSKLKELFRIIAWSSIPTETILVRQKYTRLDGGSLLALTLKRFVWVLGHFRIWREFLRAVEYHFFHDDHIWREYFDRYKPDAVFATGMMQEEDITLAKHARRRSISVLGMTRSWDNLTSKLFLRIKPDLLLVQNRHMIKEAIRYGDMPLAKVRAVGFPQWDSYLDSQSHASKEETARIIGADPKKRWILVFTGGLSTAAFRMEGYGDHIDMIGRAMEKGEIENSALIAKFHPLDELPALKERDGVTILHFGKGFNFSGDDIKLMLNLLRWSDVVVVFGSTMSMEAVIFDKPVVLAAFDGYKEQPYQKNLAVALSHTTHYVELQEIGGMWRVGNGKELIDAIQRYLKNPQLHAGGRKKMREEFIEPLDGDVAKRVLEYLLALAKS